MKELQKFSAPVALRTLSETQKSAHFDAAFTSLAEKIKPGITMKSGARWNEWSIHTVYKLLTKSKNKSRKPVVDAAVVNDDAVESD